MIIAIIILIVLLIPDLYVWNAHVRGSHIVAQTLYWMPFLVSATLMILVRTPFYQDWMMRWAMVIILIFTAPKLFYTLFSVFGMLVQYLLRLAHVTVEWGSNPILGSVHGLFSGAGLLSSIGIAIIVVYGLFFGWRQLAVHEVTLEFDDLPEGFDGYRIAHLSDLHIGTYLASPESVDNIVKVVNQLSPDMICFTGDLVNSAPSELHPFVEALSTMKARDGVYSIMGNHDYCSYRHYDSDRQRLDTIAELQRVERQIGWDLLLNEGRIIHHGGDSILLAGVENSSRPPFPDYGDLKRSLSSANPASPLFTILLSHDPTHWRREVLPKSNVNLQLSGHTHATQFKIFGWTPAKYAYDEWGGLYEEGKRMLYVSTGTGGNVAFRFGVVPEIVVITLKRK